MPRSNMKARFLEYVAANPDATASDVAAALDVRPEYARSTAKRNGIVLKGMGTRTVRAAVKAPSIVPSIAIAPKRSKNVRGGVPHNPIGLNGTVKSTACGVVRSLDAAGAPAPLNLTIMDLALNSCRWPVSGEKESTMFCGHPKAPGLTSYCPHHRDQSAGFQAVEVAAA